MAFKSGLIMSISVRNKKLEDAMTLDSVTFSISSNDIQYLRSCYQLFAEKYPIGQLTRCSIITV